MILSLTKQFFVLMCLLTEEKNNVHTSDPPPLSPVKELALCVCVRGGVV